MGHPLRAPCPAHPWGGTFAGVGPMPSVSRTSSNQSLRARAAHPDGGTGARPHSTSTLQAGPPSGELATTATVARNHSAVNGCRELHHRLHCPCLRYIPPPPPPPYVPLSRWPRAGIQQTGPGADFMGGPSWGNRPKGVNGFPRVLSIKKGGSDESSRPRGKVLKGEPRSGKQTGRPTARGGPTPWGGG